MRKFLIAVLSVFIMGMKRDLGRNEFYAGLSGGRTMTRWMTYTDNGYLWSDGNLGFVMLTSVMPANIAEYGMFLGTRFGYRYAVELFYNRSGNKTSDMGFADVAYSRQSFGAELLYYLFDGVMGFGVFASAMAGMHMLDYAMVFERDRINFGADAFGYGAGVGLEYGIGSVSARMKYAVEILETERIRSQTRGTLQLLFRF